MAIRLGYGRGWVGGFVIQIITIFLRGYYLSYTNFLILNDKGSLTGTTVVPVHASGSRKVVAKLFELETVWLVVCKNRKGKCLRYRRKGIAGVCRGGFVNK